MFLFIEIIPAIFTSAESLIISFFLDQIFIKKLRIGIRTTGIIINLSIPGSISRSISGSISILRAISRIFCRICDLIGSIIITGITVLVGIVTGSSAVVGRVRRLGGVCRVRCRIRSGGILSAVRGSGIRRSIVVIIAVLGIDSKSASSASDSACACASAAVSGASLNVLVLRALRTLTSLGTAA